ncbi:MAG: hypothetical protein BWY69_00819 [Planctomycetes bacterium ADurb.Bin401]|nr:MAG: hypothetical protein BWY69_00819 [Planctomycetes bacterium ADurb.Bin401]
MILQIGGYQKGTDYDFLSIAGSAIIEGIIDISLINGFMPDWGDTFDIMTAELGIQIGSAGLQLQGCDMFTFILSEDGKTLSLQTVPEPASFLFLTLGLLVLRKFNK